MKFITRRAWPRSKSWSGNIRRIDSYIFLGHGSGGKTAHSKLLSSFRSGSFTLSFCKSRKFRDEGGW